MDIDSYARVKRGSPLWMDSSGGVETFPAVRFSVEEYSDQIRNEVVVRVGNLLLKVPYSQIIGGGEGVVVLRQPDFKEVACIREVGFEPKNSEEEITLCSKFLWARK